MSNLILKIQYGDDTRRVSMEREPTFLELRKMSITFFKINSFLIKYVDEDNDLITITSDSDLKEAFSVRRQPPNVLKLFISKDEQPTTTTSTTTTTNTNSSVPSLSSSTTSTPVPLIPINLTNQQLPLNLKPLVDSILSNPQIVQLASNTAMSAANAAIPQIHTSVFSCLNPNGTTNTPVNLENLNKEVDNLLKGLNIGSNSNSGSQNWLNDIIQSSLQNVFSTINNNNNNNNSQQQQQQQQQQSKPTTTTTNNNNNNNDDNNNNNNNVEHSATCDLCQKRIFGNRYKCTICEDYDLCSKCESKGIHPSTHPTLKMSKPIPVTCSWESGIDHSSKPFKCPRPVKKFASRYVSDISIKDGTVLTRGEQFTKVWRVRNDGEQKWPEGTTLQFLSGDRFGYNTNISIPSALPGQDIDISVDLVAPSKTGRFTGYWRLNDSDNVAFGQSIWVDVYIVEAPKPIEEYIFDPPKFPDSEDEDEDEEEEEKEKEKEEDKPSIEEEDEELKNETDSFCFLSNVPFVSAPSPFSIPPPPVSSSSSSISSLILDVPIDSPVELQFNEPLIPLEEPAIVEPVVAPLLQVVEPVAAPVAAPVEQPVVVDPQEEIKRKCIGQLVSMGFDNSPNIVDLIKRYNFNINEIVEHLLNEQQ